MATPSTDIGMMNRCIDLARMIMKAKNLAPYQSDLVLIATTLFNHIMRER